MFADAKSLPRVRRAAELRHEGNEGLDHGSEAGALSSNLQAAEMRDLAQRLLACEAHKLKDGQAVVQVSETLRRSLTTLAGGSGFRALLARALALARVEAPSLSAVEVEPDGSLQGLSRLEGTDAAAAGVILTAQLLGLLCNFIGEPLVLRMLLEIWPDLCLDDRQLEEGKSA